jgi:hypothetical protein
MARKTKAELAAEREAYEAAQRAAEALTYPVLLMRALEEATQKNNYELTVRDGLFELRDRDSSDFDLALTLAYQYNTHSQIALENLESDLRDKAEERAESLRLSELRKIAWAKLSDEERHALGLTARNNW